MKMNQALPPPRYGGPHSVFSKPLVQRSPRDEDTEALAGFLLSLKHRSVTPEPLSASSNDPFAARLHHHAETSYSSYRAESPPAPYYQQQQQAPAEPTPPQSPYVMAPLHEPGPDAAAAAPSLHSSSSAGGSSSSSSSTILDIESLIQDSKLVVMTDRDLVPDPLFAAMAQMKPCRLQHADRVGCYKNRALGFWGMCCKHCGGQPGFGRYYPNSVRSLAQTTTSQTILKHIGSKCRYCPPEIRRAILELQRVQAAREGLPTGRPRYGSRKVFFQRVWKRLHGDENEDDDGGSSEQSSSSPPPQQPHALDESEEKACVSIGSKTSTSSCEGDEEAALLGSSEDDDERLQQQRGDKRKKSHDYGRRLKRTKFDDRLS